MVTSQTESAQNLSLGSTLAPQCDYASRPGNRSSPDTVMSMGWGTEFPMRGKGWAKGCFGFQMPETEKRDALLFPGIFHMGNLESKTTSVTTPLGFTLKNWNTFDPQTWKNHMIFCTHAWSSHS